MSSFSSSRVISHTEIIFKTPHITIKNILTHIIYHHQQESQYPKHTATWSRLLKYGITNIMPYTTKRQSLIFQNNPSTHKKNSLHMACLKFSSDVNMQRSTAEAVNKKCFVWSKSSQYDSTLAAVSFSPSLIFTALNTVQHLHSVIVLPLFSLCLYSIWTGLPPSWTPFAERPHLRHDTRCGPYSNDSQRRATPVHAP